MVEDCYFDISWSSSVYPLDYASSSICKTNSFYVNSTVTGNVTDSDINGGLFEFWLHDLNLDITITDNIEGFMGPINASFWCCDNPPQLPYNATIESTISSFTVTSENIIMSCPSTDTITCKVFVMSREQYLFPLIFMSQWKGLMIVAMILLML